MTLAPLVDPSVRGVEGKPAAIGGWCVVPGCISKAQQRHHLWPKSYLRGQPYEWVSVHDRTLPNSVGTCVTHHNWVTGGPGGHRAKITYSPTLGLFEWWERDTNGDFILRGPLRGQALVDPEPEARRVRRQEGLCPTCGRALPHEHRKTQDGLPKRPVETWTVTVPKDSEIGADVLNVYVEDLGVLMGFENMNARLLRYHVLAPVLAWVTQEKARFVREWEEAGD